MEKGTSIFLLLGGLAFLWPNPAAAKTLDPVANLVENPGFEMEVSNGGLPQGWRTVAPRPEIAPGFTVDSSVSHSGKSSAKTEARGSLGTFGYWETTVKGIQAGASDQDPEPSALTMKGSDFLGHKSYRVTCFFKPKGIESLARNIWIRATWLDGKGQDISMELLSRFVKEGEWYQVGQILTAPRTARSLKLGLVLQWSATGAVWWDDVRVEEALPPAPRRIKVGTVSYQIPGRSTPEKNRAFFAEKITAAGKLGVDLLCLGEGITALSTGRDFNASAESVPGPTSQVLGDAARKSRLYVVVGIYERDGPLVYNTALLIDREGKIAGKYRKTHLPVAEVSGGITPGSSYPVFQTDFGKVGIEICYDNFFPEVARSLALRGAEIILLPIAGDLRGEGYAWDIVARARAIDNAIFLVASIYDNRRSLIVDPDGHILADTKRNDGLVTAEIDLGARTFERWLSVGSYGEWKTLYPQERRGETYLSLVKQEGQ